MRPAVFFDRDGTLIEQVDELARPEEVRLLPGVGEAVADLNRRGFLVIVITNQPNIEKGLVSQEDLSMVHAELSNQLADYGAHIDAFYTCPHKYRAEGQCTCRKPGLGLIEKAQSEFPIDIQSSWMIGDRLRDIETGKRAGLRTIFVPTGGVSTDDEFFLGVTANHTAPNLLAAVTFL